MSSELSLETLYEEHAQALFGFLLNLTRHEADTRDLLQEIFIKLARQPELLNGVRSPRGFLLRMAHHATIDAIRKSATRTKYEVQLGEDRSLIRLFAASPDPDREAFRQSLTEALGALPNEQRAVVHLKLWEQMTFEEIAATLEIPLNTAASRYRYGLDKLRGRLRPLFDEIN